MKEEKSMLVEKVDFEKLRLLEKKYLTDEKTLINAVHKDYKDWKEKISDFFKELKMSERWYRERFKEYNFGVKSPSKSHPEEIQKGHATRRINTVLDELKGLKVSKDFLGKPEERINTEVVEDDDYIIFENSLNQIKSLAILNINMFKVKDKYKKVLIKALDVAIENIIEFRDSLEGD